MKKNLKLNIIISVFTILVLLVTKTSAQVNPAANPYSQSINASSSPITVGQTVVTTFQLGNNGSNPIPAGGAKWNISFPKWVTVNQASLNLDGGNSIFQPTWNINNNVTYLTINVVGGGIPAFGFGNVPKAKFTMTVDITGSQIGGPNQQTINNTFNSAVSQNVNTGDDNATGPIQVLAGAPVIAALTDTPSALPGTNTPSVIENDTLNGEPAVIGIAAGQVTLTSTPNPNSPLTMNTDGTITVAANTVAGTYSISYTICEVSNPTSCSTVSSTVTVTAAVISAINDSYDPQCNASATLGNVLKNDKLNMVSAVANEVTITLESGANANITLNTSSGELSINSGITFGEYTLMYKICEKLNPANCSNGAISIKITQKTKPEIVDCSDTFTFVNCDWVKDNKLPVIR